MDTKQTHTNIPIDHFFNELRSMINNYHPHSTFTITFDESSNFVATITSPSHPVTTTITMSQDR